MLRCSREDIEEVADYLDLLRVFQIALEVDLLELVMGEAVEVVTLLSDPSFTGIT